MRKRCFTTFAFASCLAAALLAPAAALAYDNVTSAASLQAVLGSDKCSVSGDTVTLTENVNLTDTINITEGTIILDLNGKTITGCKGPESGDAYGSTGDDGKTVLSVGSRANLTIEDTAGGAGLIRGGKGSMGTYGGGSAEGGMGGDGGHGLVVNGGVLVVNGGNIAGGDAGQGGTGGDSAGNGGQGGLGGRGLALASGSTVVINSGVFDGGKGGEGGWPSGGSTVSGGYPGMGGHGGNAVWVDAASISIRGGFFNGGNAGLKGAGSDAVPDGMGGDALYAYGTTVITVEGGTFFGGNTRNDGRALKGRAFSNQIGIAQGLLVQVGTDVSSATAWDEVSSLSGYRYVSVTSISLPKPDDSSDEIGDNPMPEPEQEIGSGSAFPATGDDTAAIIEVIILMLSGCALLTFATARAQ